MSLRLALAAILILAACARPDPGLRATLPHPAVPADVLREDVALPGLYAQRWRAPDGAAAPRGILVIVHGLKDHSDRYTTLAVAAVHAGYAVYALDLRGHARSPGPRVTIDHFDHYVDDADHLVQLARHDFPGLPTFVFGHSMGGAIVTRLAETRGAGLAGIVLSGPAVGIDAPAFQAAAIIAAGAPGLGRFPGFEPPTRDFSADPEVTAGMARDPLIFNHGAPVHTAAEVLGAIGAIWDDAASLTVPVIILHGTADRLTAPAASRDFLARTGTADRTLHLYEGAWHDLAHEPTAPAIVADLLAWMDARLAGPLSAAEIPPLPTRRLAGDRTGLVERHHLRGAVITDPDTAGDLDASLAFAAGRRLMFGASLEGRLALTDGAASAAWGAVTLGTRLGTTGWITLGAGGGRLGGDWHPIAHGELAVGPRGWPVAVHLRADATRIAGDSSVETEVTLRVPGNRTFWGRGRRGAGLTLGARTVDRADSLAIVIGFESAGFD